jgi:hypothetical protein
MSLIAACLTRCNSSDSEAAQPQYAGRLVSGRVQYCSESEGEATMITWGIVYHYRQRQSPCLRRNKAVFTTFATFRRAIGPTTKKRFGRDPRPRCHLGL